ncbi:ABC transporter ATP-binding protein [Micromonospora sagamiensis]|uniref:Branched-chain amino acid transport system ATP-binding protein n=1 Tax=Micromonospora sagamiensis TaxID=47875 RepID=A0A562WF23_9ACTN|nr:ABC transporter ATP-binding protein [Micromonospora sagamiensis]TWJ28816.1 branched-chain amino acid transport system ATP-binding protein [Micromonospora sagamiensis]BCL12278.1 ABC transporter ATP-binding protein [Micromonospora sagamiensis]
MAADTTSTPVLSLRDVHAGYQDVEILRGIDLDLHRGETVCVVGANGAGKSTLLRTVFGMVATRRGSIRVDGVEVSRDPPRARLARGVVLVPQGRCNFPRMSVEENLRMGGYTLPRAAVAAGIDRAYQTFPVLGERRRQAAGDLSGGEQQLLEMAMALMLDPKVVLIDEPSLGLSPRMRHHVFAALHALATHQVGVLLVEQNAVQALAVADRGLVVELGRVAKSGTGPGMLDDPDVRRAYLGLPT